MTMNYPQKEKIPWQKKPEEYIVSQIVSEQEVEDGEPLKDCPEDCYLEFELRRGWDEDSYYIITKRKGGPNPNYTEELEQYNKYLDELKEIDRKYKQDIEAYEKDVRRQTYETLRREFADEV